MILQLPFFFLVWSFFLFLLCDTYLWGPKYHIYFIKYIPPLVSLRLLYISAINKATVLNLFYHPNAISSDFITLQLLRLIYKPTIISSIHPTIITNSDKKTKKQPLMFLVVSFSAETYNLSLPFTYLFNNSVQVLVWAVFSCK